MIVHPITRPARNTTTLRWLLSRTCGPLLESGRGQQKLVPACCLMHIQHSRSARQPARGPAFGNARLYGTAHNTQEKTVSAELPSLEPPEAVEGTTASQHVHAPPPRREVAILWDLDNVRPDGLVAEAVRGLRRLATARGDVVVELYAAASMYAFGRVPEHVREERASRRRELERASRRRELERASRRKLGRAEDSGRVPAPEGPSRCPGCGAKFKTNKLVQLHYRRLHKRELAKKMINLKLARKRKGGKKAENLLHLRIWDVARRAAVRREVMGHEKGYGLKSQLQLAGVEVKVVSGEPQSGDKALEKEHVLKSQLQLADAEVEVLSDEPQSADKVPEKEHELKRQLQLAGVEVEVVSGEPQAADKALEQRWWSLAGTKCLSGKKSLSALVLVSDDNGFHRVLTSARKRGVRTIVVGKNSGGKLAQRARKWVSWDHITSGITVGAFEPQDGEV